MPVFCSSCGNALPPAARFCSTCGTVVAGAPQAGYPPYIPPPFAPRLHRPIYGRQFAGVCVGVARTYGWDVGLVRIFTVIGGIFLFPFVEIVYIAGWIGIPQESLVAVQSPMQPPA